MWPNPQETEDLVTFAEEILSRKINFLCSAIDDFLASFESAFCMKTVTSRLFKIYLKRRENHTVSFVPRLAEYQYKWIIENSNSKSRNNSQFMAILWPLFSDIRSAWRKVNYICWKRLVLVHFRRFYENMYITALLCIWTYFYFAWKGFLETLNVKCLFVFIRFQRDLEAVAQRCSVKRCL